MSQVTKRALEASLKNLLLKKPLSKITIKPFIMNVYHSVSREQVENYLYKVTYDLLEGVVEEQAQGMSVRDEDKAFIATVYKYAFVGLMLDWIKNDMKGDSQLLVDRLELVIHGNVRAALERLRIDKA